MHRRSLLQLLAAFSATLPWRVTLAQAQGAPLTPETVATLRAVAAAVLPSALDARGTDAVVESFLTWLRGYRSGADMGFGYGIVRKRVTPTIEPARYVEQLRALENSVAPAFSRSSIEARRRAIAAALDAAGIKDFPSSPNGGHAVADFMGYYFHGSDANDLCHLARIGRDRCRTLAGSSRRPAPLTKA